MHAENHIPRGVAQLVAHLVWDQGVAGSNPVAPTPQGVRANSNAFFGSQRALPSFGCSSPPCRKTKVSYRTAANASKGALNSRLFTRSPHLTSSLFQDAAHALQQFHAPFRSNDKKWGALDENPPTFCPNTGRKRSHRASEQSSPHLLMILSPNVFSNYSTPFCCVPHNPYLEEWNVIFTAKRNPHDEPKHLTMRVLLCTLCRFTSIERDLAPCHNINSRTQAGRIAVATQQFSVKVVDLECLTRLSVR